MDREETSVAEVKTLQHQLDHGGKRFHEVWKDVLEEVRDEFLDQSGNPSKTLGELQERIIANKHAKGFDTVSVRADLDYLIEEMGELAVAMRDPDREDFVEGLTDVTILCLGMMSKLDVEAYKPVVKKILINERRPYLPKRAYFVREDRTQLDEEVVIPKEWIDHPLPLYALQQKIWANKEAKGFDRQSVEQDYVNMGEELAELTFALRKGVTDKQIDALADLLIYTWGLIERLNRRPQVARWFRLPDGERWDVYELVVAKMVINEQREYKKIDKGGYVREDQEL
jgi:NTP pyrophosphatase (non-canonical NTP hydrolase)